MQFSAGWKWWSPPDCSCGSQCPTPVNLLPIWISSCPKQIFLQGIKMVGFTTPLQQIVNRVQKRRGMGNARMCCPVGWSHKQMVNIMSVPKIPWGTEFYLTGSKLNQCTVSSSPLVILFGIFFFLINPCVDLFWVGRMRRKSSLLRKPVEQIIFPRFPRKGSGSFIQASSEAFEKQTHFATDSTWYQLWTDTSAQAAEHEVLCAAVDAP